MEKAPAVSTLAFWPTQDWFLDWPVRRQNVLAFTKMYVDDFERWFFGKDVSAKRKMSVTLAKIGNTFQT